MADTKAYTVGTGFKLNGRFQQAGSTVHLTEDEHAAYAAHVEGKDYVAGVAYLPGQEPQERTAGQDPMTLAQAQAGDPVAQVDVAGRKAVGVETRGDVEPETDGETTMTGGVARSARVSTAKQPK